MIWQQNLDQLRAYIERLENDLAAADSLIATHAHTLDPSPPEKWPRGSILQAAVGRHTVRCAEERLARATALADARRRS